ncbi:DUF2213 domain-containing protein, partial [Novosphingobium sp. 28-62-57]|uniref:DUF2213 domain-containing protein n=1 Tax=Novosphingobium sp. 28-62-57 TaxID=1970409 RepID=UPI0025FF3556
MQFVDRLLLDAPRRTSGGFLAVRAKAARVGTYDYLGSEIDPENKHGLRDKGMVKVLRDEATVFDKAAAQSFIGKPITDDHPTEAVTADNWRRHARGTVMGAIRDGDYLAFDLLLTDADAIRKVDAGKRELSNGYSAELEFGDFTAADGTKCQARQTSITGNHVALVDRGRAGSECRIADAAICDSLPRSFLDSLTVDGTAAAIGWLEKAIALHRKHMSGKAPTTGDAGEKSQQLMMEQMENALSELKPSANKTMKMDQLNTQEKPVKTMLIDGLTVDVSNADTAMATITTLIAARDAATGKLTGLEAKSVADAATIVAKDAEIAKLTADVAAAKPTLQQLRDAGKQFAVIEGKAKAMGVTVTDAMDEATIMKAVVDAKMGDAAKDYTADHVAIAFAALT